MKLKGKSIAILAENDYQDLELWYPYYRMKEEGANVIVVGTGSSDIYKSKHGYEVRVDKTADKVSAKDFDAVIIPGGWAPDRLRQYESVVNFVRDMFNRGKIVASICHGGSVLVSAGILKGKTTTSYKAIKDDLISAGANFVDKEVVVDKNLITSRRPDDLPAFCREIISILSK